MAAVFDVSARIAEGLSALDDIQTYVSASQARGYSNADLTLHTTQVRDWYGTEDGLDLRLLDSDCGSLRNTAQVCAEALAAARDATGAQPRAWRGSGADSCAEFLRQHCDSADRVVNAVLEAARVSERLRDELWRAVDDKVAVTVDIADQVGPRRDSWLSAARAVLAGATAEAVLSVVDNEIAPFVAQVVGIDWLTGMRAAVGKVEAAYRLALGDLDQQPAIRFEIPGELGPDYVPAAAGGALAGRAPLADDWMGAWPNLFAAPADLPLAAANSAPVDPIPAPVPAAVPEAPGPSGPLPMPGAGGLPDLGAATTAPGRMVDALSGLLPDPGTGPDPLTLPEPPDIEPVDLERPAELEEPTEEPAEDGEPESDLESEPETDPETEETPETDDDIGDPADAQPDEQPDEQQPAEQPSPAEPKTELAAPSVDCDPPAPPPADPATPCEMAADELPQVGG